MDDESFQAALQQIQKTKEAALLRTVYRTPRSVHDPKAHYAGFHQRTRIFPAGQPAVSGYAPLTCSIVLHESVPVKLHDATTIYTDICLPASFENLDQP